MPKRRFLTVYDYGTGGVWQWITANTVAEIAQKYPALLVVPDIPKWMTEPEAGKVREYDTPSGAAGQESPHGVQVRRVGTRTARPNPSVEARPNGGPPGPVWRYAVHFRQPGPGVLPSSPA